jgi:hypothetical protein
VIDVELDREYYGSILTYTDIRFDVRTDPKLDSIGGEKYSSYAHYF